MTRRWPWLAIPAVVVLIVWLAWPSGRGEVQKTGDRIEVKTADAELIVAVKKARNTVGQFISALQTRPLGAKGFGIIFPLRGDVGVEHVRIRVESYRNGKFLGTLADKQSVSPNLHQGDHIEVRTSEIDDWFYTLDGQLQGAFTKDVIGKLANQ